MLVIFFNDPFSMMSGLFLDKERKMNQSSLKTKIIKIKKFYGDQEKG